MNHFDNHPNELANELAAAVVAERFGAEFLMAPGAPTAPGESRKPDA